MLSSKKNWLTDYYHFDSDPFTLLPSADVFYPDGQYKEVITAIDTALAKNQAFVLVRGEIGTGKSTVVMVLREHLAEYFSIAYQANASFGLNDFSSWIASTFGIDIGDDPTRDLPERLSEYIRQQADQGKRVLLLLDEAQSIPLVVLEELSALSRLMTSREAPFYCVLFGQKELAYVGQRVDYHLQPLDEVGVRQYIDYRLTLFGGEAALFTNDACARIFQQTQGIPRLINRQCVIALLAGAQQEGRQITAALVESVEDGCLAITAKHASPVAAEESERSVVENRKSNLAVKLKALAVEQSDHQQQYDTLFQSEISFDGDEIEAEAGSEKAEFDVNAVRKRQGRVLDWVSLTLFASLIALLAMRWPDWQTFIASL